MKVFSVCGITKSGKTTVIEKVIQELKNRNYRVGSVKDIHFEEFTIDKIGSNTWRHKQAGSEIVVARGLYETDILIPRRLDYKEILKYFDHDFVVMEGMAEADVPKILCAHEESELEERWGPLVFAVSGRISEKISIYRNTPVVNVLKDVGKLVNLIEEKVSNEIVLFDE
jgi:molybdopterin-guanine dinucleotide biosynthesis protein B